MLAGRASCPRGTVGLYQVRGSLGNTEKEPAAFLVFATEQQRGRTRTSLPIKRKGLSQMDFRVPQAHDRL